MQKSNIKRIAVVGGLAAAGLLAYKYYAAKSGSDAAGGEGSLGGTDDLLGDQGFNVDPNSPIPNYYNDPRAAETQGVPIDEAPSPTPDNSPAQAPTPASSGEGIDWARTLRDIAIFGAGTAAADIGVRKAWEKYSSKKITTPEEAKAQQKVTDDRYKTPEERIKGKAEEPKISERLTAEKNVRDFDLNPEASFKGKSIKIDGASTEVKVATEGAELGGRAALRTAGKVAGNAAAIFAVADLGSYWIQATDKGIDFQQNIYDKVRAKGGSDAQGKTAEVIALPVTMVYTAGYGTYNFGKDIYETVRHPVKSLKAVKELYDDEGFFKGTYDLLFENIEAGVKKAGEGLGITNSESFSNSNYGGGNVGSSFNTVNPTGNLGNSANHVSSSSASNAAAVAMSSNKNSSNQSAQQQLFSALGISAAANPFTSSQNMSMNTSSSSGGSSSSKSSGGSVSTNKGTFSSVEAATKAGATMSVAPKQATPQNMSKAPAPQPAPSTKPSVVQNVVSSVKNLISKVTGGSKKK